MYAKPSSRPLKEGRKVPWKDTVAANRVRSAPQHGVPPSKAREGFAPVLNSEQRGEEAAGKTGREKRVSAEMAHPASTAHWI